MSDLFTRLAERALGASPAVTVRSSGWFGPIGDTRASGVRAAPDAFATRDHAGEHDPAGRGARSASGLADPLDPLDPHAQPRGEHEREHPAAARPDATLRSRRQAHLLEGATVPNGADRAESELPAGDIALPNGPRPSPVGPAGPASEGRHHASSLLTATSSTPSDISDPASSLRARRHHANPDDPASRRSFTPLVSLPASGPASQPATSLLAGEFADLAHSRQTSASAPIVRVTIGRVEVRAALGSEPAPRPRREPAGRELSLGDYLARRRGARR
jgi:hypothetical protein